MRGAVSRPFDKRIPGVTIRRATNAYKAGRTTIVGSTQFPFSKGVETHSNSTANALNSLAERVLGTFRGAQFVHTARPTDFVDDTMRGIRQSVLRHMGPVQPKMTHMQYAMSLKGSKRTVAERAAQSLMEKALVDRDANLSSFVKKSKDKCGALPRLIQPRGPRFNVMLGSWLRPIEHKVYRAFATSRGYTVIHKHLNPEQRGAQFAENYAAFKRPVMVGLDASRFDKHISPAALEFEASLYLAHYRHDPELVRLLRMQIQNKGYINTDDGDTIVYTVNGSRMSGDVNTSLGNVIIMAILALAYCDIRGIKARLANDGDDCVVFLEEDDLEVFLTGLEAWFLAKGFPMTVEQPVRSLEEIEFCQCKPMFISGRWIMVRSVVKCLQHDTLYIGPEREYEKILAATGLCGLSLYGDVPVLGVFYRALARVSPLGQRALDTGKLTGGLAWSYRCGGASERAFNPSPEDRYSFYCSSGIKPAEQEELERYYRELVFEAKAPLEREDSNHYRHTIHELSSLLPLL